MIRIIQLMTEKNHFLEKFNSINDRQIVKLEAKNYEDIENFYNARENLIKIIKYLDKEIYKAHQQHKELNAVFTIRQKEVLKESLKKKEALVSKIIEQDVTVLSLIDQAKTEIIKELQDVKNTQKAMKQYDKSVA